MNTYTAHTKDGTAVFLVDAPNETEALFRAQVQSVAITHVKLQSLGCSCETDYDEPCPSHGMNR